MSLWEKCLKKENEMYMIFTHPKCEPKSRIVSFDFDDTLVTPKSGKKFAASSEDWKLLNNKVIPTIQDEIEKEGKIVIFTNQKGIMSKGAVDFEKCKEFCDRLEQVSKEFEKREIYIQAFVSISDNKYRKPLPGMWELLEKKNNGVVVDKKKSVYVGDAAGRPEKWAAGKKKDFSCSDRQFAKNVGIDFFTPEEYFLGNKRVSFEWDDVDMNSFPIIDPNERLEELHIQFKHNKEIILFVGSPGSGKSSFYEKYLKGKGYGWINMDTLGTKAKCLSEAKRLIQTKSIVIDNTNPSVKAREEFVSIAKQFDVKIRCFFFDYDRKLSEHLNGFRTVTSNKHIPPIALNIYYKNLVKPTLKEGFEEVITIPFGVDLDCLKTEEEKKYFFYFY